VKGTVRPFVVRDEAGDQRRPVRAVDSAALREPRGMAILGDTLYVADLDRVHAYHRESFAIQPVIELDGAREVVALAAGARAVYAADRAGNAIYRIDGTTGEATVLARGDELGEPSAVVAFGDKVWVTGEKSGELYALDTSGKRVAGGELPFDHPVGLATLGSDGFLVVDGDTGDIHLGRAGGWRLFVEGAGATGPIDVDRARGHILIPRAGSDSVRIQPL
jgi:outer membrane protein assembly factor BamB